MLVDLSVYQELSASELTTRIRKAKADRNAVLLVHNYQEMEIQAMGDFLGDSLGLSQQAAKTDADLIEFCGVDFMAESAKILNPDKKVLIPEKEACCPMAAMITPEALRQMKARYPEAIVVCYVNTSAAVKAESDICCTSANAVQVVRSVMDRQIIFVPDRNLAAYVAYQTGADMISWPGHCYVHNRFSPAEVRLARAAHPQALLIVHPECRPEVTALADAVASTSGMVSYVSAHQEEIRHTGLIIGTEIGLVRQLQQKHPDLGLFALSTDAVCTQMKRNSLAKVAWSLENDQHQVEVPQDVMDKARLALERMLAVS